MDRAALKNYILETYHAVLDYPWQQYPNYAVFRRGNNQKWFALMMDLPKKNLGLNEDGLLEVVNLKCDPVLIASLRSEPGFFPAYHMNKTNWITVCLDGTVPAEKLKLLLDMSYELTPPKLKAQKTQKK